MRDRPDGLPETADVLSSGAGRPVSCWPRRWRASPTSARWSSTAGTARSRSGRPTGSRAAPSRCSGRSASPTVSSPRATRSTRSRSGARTPTTRPVITRTGRIQDVEDDLSEMPHVIVNQARMLDLPARAHGAVGGAARAALRAAGGRDRGRDRRRAGDGDARARRRAARRPARRRRSGPATSSGATAPAAPPATAIGRELVGDPMNQAWGVMDVLAVTDFPDIRLKSAITSRRGQHPDHPARGRVHGAALHRAGRRRPAARDVTPEKLAAVANRILHPYVLDVRDVGWWSVYEVGQRLCDRFDDVPAGAADRLPRVFIAGDACHTHSAKAGQGMNVSMADTWNLGWKLAAVLRGTGAPGAAAHLLRGAPGGRAGADRLRPRVRGACSARHPGGQAGGPGEVPALLPRPGPLHRGRRGPVRAVDDHGRRGAPAPRRGAAGGHAVPLRAGDPAGRRQADAPRARRAGRRRLAALPLRRPRPGVPAPRRCARSSPRRRPRSCASPRPAPSPTR